MVQMSICSDVYTASILTDPSIFMGNAAASLLVDRLVADCTDVTVHVSTLCICCSIQHVCTDTNINIAA